MENVKLLADRDVPTVNFFEMDSENDLTETWQYIGVADKSGDFYNTLMTDNLKKKKTFIEESRRIYGKAAVFFLYELPQDVETFLISVKRKEPHFLTSIDKSKKEELIKIVDKVKSISEFGDDFEISVVWENNGDNCEGNFLVLNVYK